MVSEVSTAKGKRIFYGWWIVASASVVQALQGGLYFYGMSTFYMTLLREFGWSSTALSGVFSLSRLESGIVGPVAGFIIDRFGPRKLMILGFAMVGVGFILFSQINSIEMLYLVFILFLSVGSSIGFQMPANSTVAKWFIRRRGLALGITMCGVGVGGAFTIPLAWLMTHYGWRSTAVGAGLLFLTTGIPLALVMRRRPELYGMRPDGDPADEESERESPGADAHGSVALAERDGLMRVDVKKAPAEVNFTPRQALATSAFWLFSLVYAVRYMIASGVGLHEIPALEHMGYSPEAAALILGLTTILSIPGRLGFGWLADRYDKRYIMGICLVMQLVGLTALAYASDLVLVVVFLIVYSPAYGGSVPLLPAVWGEYFGRASFATITGLSQIVTMWGTVQGPLIAAYAFDVTGSYQFAFQFFAGMNLVGIALLFFVRRPQLKPAAQAAAT